MKKIIIFLFIPLLIYSFGCSKYLPPVRFNYYSILKKAYRFGPGKIVPITIGKSIDIDGDLSLDRKYFYYSSNKVMGNYDIYLRALEDITTVRITNHPSKDTSPVISPDGKYLAFVSQREDPEGDIYIVKVKADKLIQKAKKNIKKSYNS